MSNTLLPVYVAITAVPFLVGVAFMISGLRYYRRASAMFKDASLMFDTASEDLQVIRKEATRLSGENLEPTLTGQTFWTH